MWTILLESQFEGDRAMSETPNIPGNIESPHDISKTLGNRCPHCGQDFSEEGLNIAVFLYGVFFLVGKEHGYAGITCPTCLNTICHHDSLENILRAKEILTGPIHLGDSEFDPNLRYFSSAEASPKNIPLIGDFHITYLWHRMNGNEPPSLSDRISVYLENNSHLEEDCLCSCFLDEKDPAGTFCYVWWFKENEIEKLLKIENDKGIKIFPRYFHRCALIEDVDRFCLNYGLFNKSLDDLKNLAKTNLDKLEKHATYHGIDFDELLDENQDIMNTGMIKTVQTDYQKRNNTAILNLTGDFLNILLADPTPWDFEAQINRLCKGFWKTKSPFSGKPLPHSLTRFDQKPYEVMNQDEQRDNDAKSIISNHREKYVQDFLFENYSNFIKNYTDCVKTQNFSYAELWALKDQYFSALNEIVKKETTQKNTNKFYRQDGFWILSYQRKTIRLKYLKGFAYMQFLVSRTNIDYSYTELHNLLDGEGQKDGDSEDAIDHNEVRITAGHTKTKESMISYKKLKRAQRVRPKIVEAIVEATELGNEKRVYRLKDGLSRIDAYCKKFLPKIDGQSKTYENVYAYKAKKDKVDRDINYALKYLKNIDEKAWRHFRFSIKNRLGRIGYESSEGPDWFTG
jgi:hypothetical protein